MYTVTSSKFIKIEDGKSVQRVEIICDTEADLPTTTEIANGKYTVGSMALIADTHEIRILNHAGEWV